MEVKLVSFQTLGDERGNLVAIETGREIPFVVKRVYYLSATKDGVRRGRHAHKKLRQLVFALQGECTFLLDNGTERKDIRLSSPTEGMLIEGLVWREMFDFSEDCILMVLADSLYDEKDYIRNYEQFLKFVHQAE